MGCRQSVTSEQDLQAKSGSRKKGQTLAQRGRLVFHISLQKLVLGNSIDLGWDNVWRTVWCLRKSSRPCSIKASRE